MGIMGGGLPLIREVGGLWQSGDSVFSIIPKSADRLGPMQAVDIALVKGGWDQCFQLEPVLPRRDYGLLVTELDNIEERKHYSAKVVAVIR